MKTFTEFLTEELEYLITKDNLESVLKQAFKLSYSRSEERFGEGGGDSTLLHQLRTQWWFLPWVLNKMNDKKVLLGSKEPEKPYSNIRSSCFLNSLDYVTTKGNTDYELSYGMCFNTKTIKTYLKDWEDGKNGWTEVPSFDMILHAFLIKNGVVFDPTYKKTPKTMLYIYAVCPKDKIKTLKNDGDYEDYMREEMEKSLSGFDIIKWTKS